MINKLIDIRNLKIENPVIIENFGGDNGLESYSVTNRYLIRNGKACFPIMGEFHFSRYPAEYWEESILKMKAGGINVLSTYVFWIHHEEERGKYDWLGNKNLHAFIKLCGKHDLRVILRIGPWAHGECRNGGFSDWLMNLGIPLRENDDRYLDIVQVLYSEIFKQVKGSLFYNGGPIIGIQIENEYGHCGGLQGEAGKKHILTLKKMAVALGFNVPFYTSTGWGNGVVVDGETLPVLGGYAEAPWEQNIEERMAEPGYLFKTVHHDTSIGTDLAVSDEAEYSYDVSRYPYLTAEIGGGHEPTHHRRPIISSDDTAALTMTFLGSGANLLGYYMYHGGTNPIGKLSTLQESKATGYQNDVPELSYDFQAPINEYGELNNSYGCLKALHLFIQDFGEEMAESTCYIPKDNPQDAEDIGSLRYSVRFGEKGGFLFLNNYQRRRKMIDKNVNIKIITSDGNYKFQNIKLPNGRYCIFPFNLKLGPLKLLSATAQLLCRVSNQEDNTFVFFCEKNEAPCYRFQSDNVKSILSDSNEFDASEEFCEICVRESEFNKAIPIILKSGEIIKIITISQQEAYNAWKVKDSVGEGLIISRAGLCQEKNKLDLVSCNRKISLQVYLKLPEIVEIKGASYSKTGTDGDFFKYSIICDRAVQQAEISEMKEYKRNEGISREFTLNRSKGNIIKDDFLNIRFDGDRARMFINGQFSADWFYNGLDWKVGLKRFGNMDKKTIKIDIDPLHEDDYVFLENKPEYQNGCACSIKEISIMPEYHCKMIIP